MRSCTIRAWRERRRGKNSAAGASRRSDGRAPRAPPGLTAGARPPPPQTLASQGALRAREPAPAGRCGAHGGGRGPGGTLILGGWLGPGGSPRPGWGEHAQAGGGGRSQGREVGCAGGGTHGRAGEGAHSVRSSVLGPAARPAPQAPNPEPGARSGGPARRPRPHAACGSRPRPLPAAHTPAPAPAPPGLSCVLRPSVRPRRSPASA